MFNRNEVDLKIEQQGFVVTFENNVEKHYIKRRVRIILNKHFDKNDIYVNVKVHRDLIEISSKISIESKYCKDINEALSLYETISNINIS